MRLITKIFLILVAAVMTFLIAVFVHLGAYKTPRIGQRTLPGMSLLYVEHIGPYNGVASLMDQVQQWAMAHHLLCEKTFGWYLDDPQTTEERRLRSHLGCILTAGAPSQTGLYKVEQFPAGQYVWASFDGSPAIGPFRVYPKIYEYARSHHLNLGHSALEVYTVRGPQELTTDYYIQVVSAH